MGWLILGVSLLAAMLLASRWLVNADPKVVAKVVKRGALAIGAAVVVFLAVTGRLALALPLAVVMLALMRRGTRSLFAMGRSAPSAGQTSDAETEYLTMTLDHDSGEMSGRILRGRFAGSELGELSLDQLIEVLAECQLHDQEAARLIETYLDRTQSEDWRQKAAGAAGAGGREARGAGAGRMTPEEAYEILGLEPGATADQIKDAHRRLIQKIHPDHGGSSYLAAKINRAKEILLGA